MQEIVMPFDSKLVEVVRDNEGNPLVSVRSVCRNIGIEPPRQIEKLKGDTRFNLSHMSSVAADGKNREVSCIPLEQLNGWLFSINPNKVPDTVRPALIAYQQECFKVLYKHFMPRGEADLHPFMERLEAKIDSMNTKFDHLRGMDLTVFGDDAPLIKELIAEASKLKDMTVPQYWGYIRRECDVSSYKMITRKIINFIKNDMGKGIRLVEKESTVCKK